MTLCVGVVGGMIFLMTRSVGSGHKDEFMGILAREAQARDHSLPYCNSSKALDSSCDQAGEWPALPPWDTQEACRSQPSSKEPQQTSYVYWRSLPGQPKESGWTD